MFPYNTDNDEVGMPFQLSSNEISHDQPPQGNLPSMESGWIHSLSQGWHRHEMFSMSWELGFRKYKKYGVHFASCRYFSIASETRIGISDIIPTGISGYYSTYHSCIEYHDECGISQGNRPVARTCSMGPVIPGIQWSSTSGRKDLVQASLD